jgi:hypothetical protein
LQTDEDYLVSADQKLSASHFFAFDRAAWLHKAKELPKEGFKPRPSKTVWPPQLRERIS